MPAIDRSGDGLPKPQLEEALLSQIWPVCLASGTVAGLMSGAGRKRGRASPGSLTRVVVGSVPCVWLRHILVTFPACKTRFPVVIDAPPSIA